MTATPLPADDPSASAPPFFVLGFQRSGTTLLRLMLDSHPDIAIPLDTTGLWDRYERRLAEYGDLKQVVNRDRLVTDLLAEERIRLWRIPLSPDQVLARWQRPGFPGAIAAFYECYAAHYGKHRWGDKDPGNMTRIDQLNRWFPDCRIIHIIRDGRDACLSQLRQDFGFDDLLDCAECWREEVQWVRRMGSILGPSRYLDLRYEDLLEDPPAVLDRVCRLLGVAFDESMLQYHRDVSAAVPESKRHIWQLIDRPPQKDNAGRWKRDLSSGPRIAFEKRTYELLGELGYERFPSRPSGGYLEEFKWFTRRILKAFR